MTNSVLNQMNRILFVYAREERIQCLNYDESMKTSEQLKREGWKHTGTIDAARWIEALVNTPEFADDTPFWLIEELKHGPAQ